MPIDSNWMTVVELHLLLRFLLERVASMVSDQKTAIVDLPPSSNLVYYILENKGTMTREQISAESRLSSQTTRCGLKCLENLNVIEREKPSASEDSRNVYSVA